MFQLITTGNQGIQLGPLYGDVHFFDEKIVHETSTGSGFMIITQHDKGSRLYQLEIEENHPDPRVHARTTKMYEFNLNQCSPDLKSELMKKKFPVQSKEMTPRLYKAETPAQASGSTSSAKKKSKETSRPKVSLSKR